MCKQAIEQSNVFFQPGSLAITKPYKLLVSAETSASCIPQHYSPEHFLVLFWCGNILMKTIQQGQYCSNYLQVCIFTVFVVFFLFIVLSSLCTVKSGVLMSEGNIKVYTSYRHKPRSKVNALSLWLLWRRTGRGPNIHAWNQLTLSLQLPLRPQGVLAH